ncbi:DsbE family thiol:disulfide interchange protein [Sphingomonas arenae]|uniref:DsbE family thiol:disulfide interchange protein n=1 Tax=Sphingomonas arenae TaxID=2812555 RepID=UPI0019681002|nr:DsbE family thiol:disulfide interchange protein [Sphingomonas arenae]
MNRRLWLALPLIVFALFVLAVGWRLSDPPDPTVKSRLVGQPVPQFTLPPAIPGKAPLSSADLAGKGPRLVNLFASWCVPCIGEAPVLMQLRRQGVQIDGIAIRDAPADVAEFLSRHGDPFVRVGGDMRSQVQMALGSSGVPESFIIDGSGVIRYQHVGPLTDADLPTILTELEKAR